MGGGFKEYNTPNDTEFNFHADPIAVKSIFQSNLSIKLIPLKIKSLIIMGGGFKEYNTPNDTEFNFHADPIAVKSIFQSNLSIKLIPLDTTQQI